ncbi:MAG: GIY-YIG nuclease family protein [Pseudomonadota bacterium]
MQHDIARRIRRSCSLHILDVTDAEPSEAAIYALADPRDLELVRYIGQTRAPRSRFLQHMNEARLWLPDELPWWIKSPHLRPLYLWIRELYAEQRLPLMMIVAWTQCDLARQEEGRHIREYLRHQKPLLNRETESFLRKLRVPRMQAQHQ